MRKVILAFVIILLSGCSSSIDFEHVNSRNYNIIHKEKELQGVRIFDTDTLLNFQIPEKIKEKFGKPDFERKVGYKYPAPNILWVLEGALQGIHFYTPILEMEWYYPKEKYNSDYELTRIFFFVKRGGNWISITNILYPTSIIYERLEPPK